MKALKKRNLIMKNQLRYAITEANVLKTANHPFILALHYAFQVWSLYTYTKCTSSYIIDAAVFIYGAGLLSSWRSVAAFG